MAQFNAAQFASALFGGGAAAAGLIPRQVAQGLLYPALRKAGVIIGPGRTPSVAQFQDAIDELNRLSASLNCDRLFIYSVAANQYPLDPSKAAYTIGQSPDPLIVPDIAAPRPQLIESANIISGEIVYGLALASDLEWVNRGSQAMPDSIPVMLYNDRAAPLSTLYFWGQPAAGLMLELFTWTQVPVFQNITDQVLLPIQYEDALVLNLAVRLAPHFQRVIDPNVRQQAQESLMRLESINAPRPIAQMGGLGCGGGVYDIYSDQ